MISFSCPHCRMKFQVKTQFAGRSSRCPTCKQPLVVPAPNAAVSITQGQIDGTPSSLARAKADSGVTLEPPTGTGRRERPSVGTLLARRAKNDQRYVVEAEIARGGMGAVLRAVDCDIRREVAVKYLLDQTDPKKKLRFVEEAQITGQLEHPNIVPIHELGVDAQQRVFFAMKMVRGRSLDQVLDELRKNARTAEKEYPLIRLLNVLVGVCNALAYAHSRGVVHRDLKPANIMVGDFGEVYVMDWGLAKVLASGGPPPSELASSRPPVAPSVATSRQGETDLTQDGAVLGTPVYMPPEQAIGHVAEIDMRSDVYSLGAILYEMLALRPPVEKEGGYLAVLMRVSQGEIVPPEQRLGGRAGSASSRSIPRELSAIAMKALAKEKKDRYQNMEALRRDIERFQEGRSVSAKEDTTREMIWKFVKRNKAFSAAAALALAILVGSMGFCFNAWRKADKLNAAYENEKTAKTKQAKDAVPAFVDAARMSAERGKYDNALQHLKFALDNDPKNAEALLLKGQILIARGHFADALTELRKYLRLKPNDADARKLAELCGRGQGQDVGTLLAIESVFTKQNAPAALAVSLLAKHGGSSQEVRRKLYENYRKRIEKHWPGRFSLFDDPTGTFELHLVNFPQLTDLSPLHGMALTKLNLGNCGQLRDLTPLQGMPLTSLNLERCKQVRDLTPLQTLPLTELNLGGCDQISDWTPLRGLPLTNMELSNTQVGDLSFLQGMKLTRLNLNDCRQVSDLRSLSGMPLAELYLNYCGQLRDLTPLQGMPLKVLSLWGCGQVRDLAPLQGMKLTDLRLLFCSQVRDLTPLKGMKFTNLDLGYCSQVRDLTPLRDMPLTALTLSGCGQVSDLRPLQGMKLTRLELRGCALVQDLAPLRGIPLAELNLQGCGRLSDLAPLRDLPITYLCIQGCPVQDLTPLQGMKFLTTLDLRDCPQLHDLTPLARTAVAELWFTPKNITRGMDAVRSMKSLKTIGISSTGRPKYAADEFWMRYAKGEFGM